MENLMEGLIGEVKRCRELLGHYEAIPTGFFGASLLRKDIELAEKAMGSGDVVEMVKTYKMLQEHEK